jgi:hypothetical protein
MTENTEWFYVKAFQGNQFLGWLGASGGGAVRFIGEETDDPATLTDVEIVGLYKSGGYTFLRAPAYHAHMSACIGGSGDNGYYAVWKWGNTAGIPVRYDEKTGYLHDDNEHVLSAYRYGSWNDASWEGNTKTVIRLEFAKPANAD